MKYLSIAIALILFATTLLAQEKQDHLGIWSETVENSLKIAEKGPDIKPKKYRVLELNTPELLKYLNQAPAEGTEMAKNQRIQLSLPMPDGTYQSFAMVNSPIMAPKLAAKYPSIQTFAGKGENASVRLDFSCKGFHAMIFTADKGIAFIDPYNATNQKYYISYYKNDYIPVDKTTTVCQHEVEKEAVEVKELFQHSAAKTAGEVLRTYRLAMAATRQYVNARGGTVEEALAAIVVTMNRVNGVFMKELAVKMELVEDNDQIIYTTSADDPYSNSNAEALIGQNRLNLNEVIGEDNYDIGHVFTTGSGGLAPGLTCSNSFSRHKAGGTTGLPNPVGDAFDIDFVAHEIGHQFNGNHSFNGSTGNCQFARVPTAAYEPGSGSTIMAYAGICASQNLQNSSDDYFHIISLEEIITYITDGNGANCAVETETGNNPPVVDAGNSGFFIPISTPFELTGSAEDPDGDSMSYCWEQFDLGPQGAPNSPTGTAPLFRSFKPNLSLTRTFPRISDIVRDEQNQGEILPDYSRLMTFRLTVRDKQSDGGGVAWDEVLVRVTDAAGPFVMTKPNLGLDWEIGEEKQVQWDVANTDQSPINCSEVDIFLSTDGGFTYPIILAENVPNNGAAKVLIPNVPTEKARVKVKSDRNAFFDISDRDFKIVEPEEPTFLISADIAESTICTPETATYELTFEAVGDLQQSVNLSIKDAPADLNISFAKNPLVAGDTETKLIIETTEETSSESHELTIVGQTENGTVEREITVILNVLNKEVATPTADYPKNGERNVAPQTTFTWEELSGPNKYEFQLATSPAFGSSIIENKINLEEGKFVLKQALDNDGVYFWRVRAFNQCGTGSYITTQAFQVTGSAGAATAPTLIKNETLVLNKSEEGFISTEELIATSPDVEAANISYQLMALPKRGKLTLNGSELKVLDTFTQADIGNEYVSYQHGGQNILPDEFQFTVETNAGGWIGITNFNIEIEPPISTDEIGEKSLLDVYPNPASDYMNFVFDVRKKQAIAIQLINTSGQVVLEQKQTLVTGQQQIQLEVKHLPAEIYYYQITGENFETSGKILLVQ